MRDPAARAVVHARGARAGDRQVVHHAHQRLHALGEIGRLRRPVVHLRVDVDGVFRAPGRRHLVVPQALQVGGLSARPRTARSAGSARTGNRAPRAAGRRWSANRGCARRSAVSAAGVVPRSSETRRNRRRCSATCAASSSSQSCAAAAVELRARVSATDHRPRRRSAGSWSRSRSAAAPNSRRARSIASSRDTSCAALRDHAHPRLEAQRGRQPLLRGVAAARGSACRPATCTCAGIGVSKLARKLTEPWPVGADAHHDDLVHRPRRTLRAVPVHAVLPIPRRLRARRIEIELTAIVRRRTTTSRRSAADRRRSGTTACAAAAPSSFRWPGPAPRRYLPAAISSRTRGNAMQRFRIRRIVGTAGVQACLR